jgi:hypothetical protein
MSVAVRHFSPEDLLAMPDGKRYELVAGELVERRMGLESSWVGVVWPNDSADQLEEKLDDYQKVAVPLVWVVSLRSRTVIVYRRDGSVSRLREKDELSGDDMISGFRCLVRDLFPECEPAPAPAPEPITPNGSH